MIFLSALFAVLIVPSILGTSVEVSLKRVNVGVKSQETRNLPELSASRDFQAVPKSDELVLLEEIVTTTLSTSHSTLSTSPRPPPPASSAVHTGEKESKVSLLRQRIVSTTNGQTSLIETKETPPFNLTAVSAVGCQGQPTKKKLVALLLYTFAGPAGDFYLGYNSLGIIKLAMLIFPLWGLIALFRGDILSKPEEDDDADLSGGPETVFCSGLALFCLFISCLLAYLIWCIVDIVQVQNGSMKDYDGCMLTS